MERKFFGIMQNGNRVFLGSGKMDDDEMEKFFNMISESFLSSKSGWFNIKESVYNIQSFAGIQIEGDEE